MERIFLAIIFTLFLVNNTSATEQQSDILFYNNEKLTIDIGWGHPSPLETYYRQNSLEYPFRMLHTANYRGHIATWKISNDKFFITKIEIEDDNYLPSKFNVKSIDSSFSDKNQVFADWFTGVLVCQKRKKKNYWETEYSVYIYIKNGEVQKSEKITKKDFERVQNISEKDSTDINLMSKYSILYLNQSYIGYYFRLHDKETIEVNGKTGYLNGKNGYSIVLEKYRNSHFDWPYNWENFELNGAPNATWEIIDDKLFITELHLNQGLSFNGPERYPIELSKVFPDESDNNTKILVKWANGIYIASFGEEIADELMPEIKRFKEKEFILMRIVNGNVVEKHTISSEFDFNNVPENTEESIKKIINDFKNQKRTVYNNGYK